MSKAIEKIKTIGETLWNHKKKAIFFSGVAAYGLSCLRQYNRDGRIRTFYALEAKKYGEMAIAPTDTLKRVTVLINENANGRKVTDNFKKNALPLLNLAGVDVTILKVKDEAEMAAMGRALDRSEADCVYVVGGDGTLTCFLGDALAAERSIADRPAICVFPGGRRNAFLCRLVPGIFEKENDVRRYCESAMAILEDVRRDVFPIRCDIVNNANADETKTYYVLSDVRAGWLEHCAQRQPKLWYWGVFRDRVVYALEFLKRFPEPLSLRVSYTEFCAGCRRCRRSVAERDSGKAASRSTPTAANMERPRSWLSTFLGSWSTVRTSPNPTRKLVDFSNVINERCGFTNSTTLETADLQIDCTQSENCSGLELAASAPFSSRFAAMRAGWARETQRLASAHSSNRPNDVEQRINDETETRIPASEITIQFAHMPNFIQKLAIAGDWAPFENFAEKTLRISATDQKIEIYSPRNAISRIQLENC